MPWGAGLGKDGGCGGGQKLELGQAVRVVVHGAVVKEETCDNQDGSVNIVYVVKPMTVEIK